MEPEPRIWIGSMNGNREEAISLFVGEDLKWCLLLVSSHGHCSRIVHSKLPVFQLLSLFHTTTAPVVRYNNTNQLPMSISPTSRARATSDRYKYLRSRINRPFSIDHKDFADMLRPNDGQIPSTVT